ncbi:MAG: mannose-1-phosphate guanylyltransferase [Syntrophomonadaceae bacterium]|nr:mannose-1-phosphate guanylyltransferase [Syntrophomonadaceae bacterium]
MKTIALILAGGSGTRLWPLSRRNMPKQLLSLIGGKTLLQETCQRLLSFIPPQDQWIITGKEHFQQVWEQVQAVHESIQVMEEPEGKDTAPAIFWAARRCQELYGDDAVLLVLPSDHLITNEKNFQETIAKGIEKAQEGFLITFGIKPTHPETDYGYIEIETNQPKMEQPYPVKAFIEKPDKIRAEQYIASGNYFWNSGMFAFHIGTLLADGKTLCKDTAEPFISSNPNDTLQIEKAYKQCQAQSIDYAVMEQTDNAWVVPASFGWSDVGSWQSLYESSPRDERGNMLRGEHILIDTNNCLIYGTERLIATVGMESTAIIDTPDALMVCPLDQTQRVKEIVEEMQKQAPKIL